jgi:hypothetical protein
MRILKAPACAALLLLLAASTASAQVQLSLSNGRVTLTATNATVRQILTEWARVGQTKIVNVERIPGAPLTLQLTNVPEQEALDILLRSVTGYMAAPRPVPVANLSHYDRILVLPTAALPRTAVTASPAASPVLQRPPAPQQTIEDNDDQPSVVQQPRGPLFPTFQLQQNGSPQGGAAASPGGFPVQPAAGAANGPGERPNGPSGPFPAGAVGTPRPGMVIQPAVQPGTPPPPGQPGSTPAP